MAPERFARACPSGCTLAWEPKARGNLISRRLAVLAVLSLPLVSSAPAAFAAPLQTLTPTSPNATWTGERASGANTSFLTSFYTGEGQCGRDVRSYCEDTLIQTNFTQPTSATLRVRIDGYDPAVSDFDLRVHASGATGSPGSLVGRPQSDNAQTSPLGEDDPRNFWAGDYETVSVPVPRGTKYFLVRVVYFGVVNGTYTGSATLTGATG